MTTFRDLLRAAKSQIREVDTADADLARRRDGTVVLDVKPYYAARDMIYSVTSKDTSR